MTTQFPEKTYISAHKNNRLFKNLFSIIGLSITQAAMYLAVVIFKLQMPYYLVLIFALTLLFSIYIGSISRALFYAIASSVIGLFISLLVVLIPPMILQDNFLVDFTFTLYLGLEVKLLIFNLVMCLISSLLGGIIGEK